MRRATSILLAAAALGAVLAADAPLAVTIVAERHTLQYVRELTALGPRLAGSEGLERAAQWAAAQLREAGLENVVIEPFTIPDRWQRERADGRIVSPIEQPLHIASLGWTPSTAAGGVVGEVVALDSASPEQIAAAAPRIR